MFSARASVLLLAVVSSAFALPQRGFGRNPFAAQATSASPVPTSAAVPSAAVPSPTVAAAAAAAAVGSLSSRAAASLAPHHGNSAPAVNPDPDPTVSKITGSAAAASSTATSVTTVAGGDSGSTSSGSGGSGSSSSSSQKCIEFTSDSSDWHYANTGNWGTKTGTFGSAGGKICVPRNDDAGGAMYVGTGASPGAGNTKLECFFPSSGSSNCDVSLVDGYSLSVTCSAGGQTIGGSTNFWNTGKKCTDTSMESEGICKNDQGYSAAQSDVSSFFQQAITGGNQYCIWVNCSQDYFFSASDDITCHVSGGK